MNEYFARKLAKCHDHRIPNCDKCSNLEARVSQKADGWQYDREKKERLIEQRRSNREQHSANGQPSNSKNQDNRGGDNSGLFRSHSQGPNHGQRSNYSQGERERDAYYSRGGGEDGRRRRDREEVYHLFLFKHNTYQHSTCYIIFKPKKRNMLTEWLTLDTASRLWTTISRTDRRAR